MTSADERIRAAQARWELQLAILQEEERRLVSAIEEHSRAGGAVPREILDRLKAARTQCNQTFQSLMSCIEQRIARDSVSAAASHGHGERR